MRRMAMMVAAVLAAAACSNDGPGETWFSSLSGLNEVPPQTTVISSGTVNFTANGSGLDYDITVQNIVGATTATVREGAGGVVGPVIATMFNGPTTGAIAYGRLSSGTIHPGDLTTMSMDSLKVLMRNGHAYVNITTQSLPNGEIRGQIQN